MDPHDDPEGMEPEVDLAESDDAFLLRVALPGVQPQDIQLEATRYRIFLSAKTAIPPAPPQGQQAHILHLSGALQAGEFQFDTALPFEIDPDAAQARYKNGTLTLRLPKRQVEAHRRVAISIQLEEMASPPAPVGASAVPAPTVTNAPSAPPPPEEWKHEGRPAAKMGMAYTPTGSEDHTTKAQSLSQQQAQPSRNPQISPVTVGQTNPLEAPSPEPAAPKS